MDIQLPTEAYQFIEGMVASGQIEEKFLDGGLILIS
jgi:hypothetical protein